MKSIIFVMAVLAFGVIQAEDIVGASPLKITCFVDSYHCPISDFRGTSSEELKKGKNTRADIGGKISDRASKTTANVLTKRGSAEATVEGGGVIVSGAPAAGYVKGHFKTTGSVVGESSGTNASERVSESNVNDTRQDDNTEKRSRTAEYAWNNPTLLIRARIHNLTKDEVFKLNPREMHLTLKVETCGTYNAECENSDEIIVIPPQETREINFDHKIVDGRLFDFCQIKVGEGAIERLRSCVKPEFEAFNIPIVETNSNKRFQEYLIPGEKLTLWCGLDGLDPEDRIECRKRAGGRLLTYTDVITNVNAFLFRKRPNMPRSYFQIDKGGALEKVGSYDLVGRIYDRDKILIVSFGGEAHFSVPSGVLDSVATGDIRIEKIALTDIFSAKYSDSLKCEILKAVSGLSSSGISEINEIKSRLEAEKVVRDLPADLFPRQQLSTNGVLQKLIAKCSNPANAVQAFSGLSPKEFDELKKCQNSEKQLIYKLAVFFRASESIGKSIKNLGLPTNDLKELHEDANELYDITIRNDDQKTFQALVDEVGNPNVWGRQGLLSELSQKGATNILKWLLHDGPGEIRENFRKEVNGKDKTMESPLMYAARSGNMEACRLLIDAGADIDQWRKVDGEWYDYLCDKSYNKCKNTREYICSLRELKEVEESRFTKHSLDTDGRPKVTREDLNRWFNAGVGPGESLGADWFVFSWAVELRDDKLVAKLLDRGANPDACYAKTPKKKYTALMLAAEKGNMNLVNKLLGLTTNVGSADERTSRKDAVKAFASGLSVWTYALPEEYFSFASEENKTAFCYAVDHKHYDVAMVLYRNGGVNVEAMLKHEAYKCNAFSYAALSIKDEAGKPLLEEMFNDSNSREPDENGMTPLMFASKAGNSFAIRAIRKSFGCDEKKWSEYLEQTRTVGRLGRFLGDKKSAIEMAASPEIQTLLQEELQTNDSCSR